MFIKKSKDTSKLLDTVFVVANKAQLAKKENKDVIDASLGSLYDDNGNFVALNSVFDNYKNLSNKDIAKYSSSFSGNKKFKEVIKEFVLDNKFKNLHSEVIATAGGSGAISITISNMLENNQEIIIPDIAWTSYAIMAKEYNLNIAQYKMFDEENKFNLNDLKNKILHSLKIQNKALVIINSPLHNPTGYSLSSCEWKELVRFINEDCDNKEIIILNDVAYLDYSFALDQAKDYLEILDNLNSNALLVIAYSCSKAFTSYGMRLGAAIIAHKDPEILENVFNAYDKSCRSYWSNSNNGAMVNTVNTLTKNKIEFLKEKDFYIKLLKERASIILKEAKEENLDIYPFLEGFFITVKIDNSIKNIYHQELLNNDIYTVMVNNGIRIAICSLPTNKCYGLAKKLKNILNKVKD